MKIIKKIKDMQTVSKKVKQQNMKIGFVPTMGALHEGHLSLVDIAKKKSDFTVVSIFVNPTQFGKNEDFKSYPKNLDFDIKLLQNKKIDVIFTPNTKEMYSIDYDTYIETPELSSVLCGRSREGHFKGVCTIVGKLFNIVQPDVAVFGEKDAQQAIIIEKMVKDLNWNVKIITGKTIREPSGLAMSSRNKYLTNEQKTDAAQIYKAIKMAEKSIKKGERNSNKIKKLIKNIISKKQCLKIDYVEIVDKQNLKPLNILKNECLIATAVWCGKARLIDNITVFC